MQVGTNEIGIIVDEMQPTGREVFFSSHEWQGNILDQTVAVLRKGGLHWKPIKEVGNGMEVLLGYVRSPYDCTLNTEWFLNGLGIWKEFNENTGKEETYIYKFPKEEARIQRLNDLFKSFDIHATVAQKGNYVVLEGNDVSASTFSKDSIGALGIDELLSFLLGLMLGYGTYTSLPIKDSADDDTSWERFYQCFVYLPLTGAIGRYEEALDEVVRCLANYGIFFQVDRLKAKIGYVRQVSCKDREVAYVFAKRLGSVEDFYLASPEQTAMQMREYENYYLRVTRIQLPSEFSRYSVLKKRSK